MNTTTATTRMTCTTVGAHRKVYALPAGATIDTTGIATWIVLDGQTVRCTEQGCTRAMRAIVIDDSHRGTAERKDCGPRCYNATGPACDCKCRGENHATTVAA